MLGARLPRHRRLRVEREAMAGRLTQVSKHLTNTYGRGLLAGDVVIITGELHPRAVPDLGPVFFILNIVIYKVLARFG